jgi:hypothetical protein
MEMILNSYAKLLNDIEAAGGISNVRIIEMTDVEWDSLLRDLPEGTTFSNGSEKSIMGINVVIKQGLLHG